MNRGFTLIELIIYIGIVTAVLIVAFNFGWEIIYGNVKSQARREVQQNVRFCLEKITRTIKEASAIQSPGLGNSSSTLSLEMSDPNLSPINFWLADNKLYINRGGGGPYELTSNRVKVTNLQFTNLSYEGTPGTVRVEVIVEHINPSGRSEYEASFNVKSTASLVAGGGAAPYVSQLRYRWRNDDGGE